MWERPRLPRREYWVRLGNTSARLLSAGVRMVVKEKAGSYQYLILNRGPSNSRREIAVPFVSRHDRTSSQGENLADSSACVVKRIEFEKSIVGQFVAGVPQLDLVVGGEAATQG